MIYIPSVCLFLWYCCIVPKTEAADFFSLELFWLLLLETVDPPLEIEYCILLKSSMISSRPEGLGVSSSDGERSFSLPAFSVPSEGMFLRARPLLFPSALMFEQKGWSKVRWEARSRAPSAISAKFNQLHQKMIPQWINNRPFLNISCTKSMKSRNQERMRIYKHKHQYKPCIRASMAVSMFKLMLEI